MVYAPSLNDIPVPSSGYIPSLSDIPLNNGNQNNNLSGENFNPSFMEKLSPNALAGLAQLGHSILNAPHNIVNAISPSLASNIPTQQNYDFSNMLKLPGTTSDKIVQSLAMNSPSIIGMGGMPLGSIGNAISSIPKVGAPIANSLGRILPQAAFGAITNQNPIQGAESQGGMQAALETLPPALNAIGSAAKYVGNFFQPQKYAEQLVSYLSGGRDLETVGKDVANKIQTSYNWIKNDLNNPMSFKNQYDNLFNSYGGVGDSSIYHRVDPIVGISQPGELESLGLNGKDFQDGSLGKQYNDFIKNPTLNNAHEFQSDLGNEIGLLQKYKKTNPLDQSSQDKLDTLNDARSALQNDIYSFTDKVDPELTNSYKNIGQDYKSEIVPYRSDTTLKKITNGDLENPTREQLISLFRNPDSDIQKILQHQNPDFKNDVTSLALGLEPETATPNAIRTAINSFGKKGLKSYLNPDVNDALQSITNREAAKGLMQGVAGGTTGYALGHLTGNPLLEGAFTYGGAKYSPYAMHFIKSGTSGLVNNKLTNALLQNYQPIGRSAATAYNNQTQ